MKFTNDGSQEKLAEEPPGEAPDEDVRMRYLKNYRCAVTLLDGKLQLVRDTDGTRLPMSYGQLHWEIVTQEDGTALLEAANEALGLNLRFEDLPKRRGS